MISEYTYPRMIVHGMRGCRTKWEVVPEELISAFASVWVTDETVGEDKIHFNKAARYITTDFGTYEIHSQLDERNRPEHRYFSYSLVPGESKNRWATPYLLVDPTSELATKFQLCQLF